MGKDPVERIGEVLDCELHVPGLRDVFFRHLVFHIFAASARADDQPGRSVGSHSVSSDTAVQPGGGMVFGHGSAEMGEASRKADGGVGGDGRIGAAGVGGMQHGEQHGGDPASGSGSGIQHVWEHHVVGDMYRCDAELCGVAVGVDEHERSARRGAGADLDGVHIDAIRMAGGTGFHSGIEFDSRVVMDFRES